MGKDETTMIAETAFSIAKYSKTQSITERLPLLKPSPEGGPSESRKEFPLCDGDFIELAIKSTLLEDDFDA